MNAAKPGEPPESGSTDQVARAAAAAYHASMDKRISVLETVFDSVLPTLATKVDIAELRTEIATGIEKLRAEIAIGNEKLRGEMGAAMDSLRLEMAIMSDKLHEDINKAHRKLVMWIVSTMIAMFLGMVAMFMSLTSYMLDTTLAQLQAIQSIQQAAPRAVPPR